MKVRHPQFPDLVKDVTDAEPWLKAGWLKIENLQTFKALMSEDSGPVDEPEEADDSE